MVSLTVIISVTIGNMDELTFDLSKAQPVSENESKKHGLILIFIISIFIILLSVIFIFILKNRRQHRKAQAATTKSKSSLLSISPTPAKSKQEVIGFLPSWIMAAGKPIQTNGLTQIILFDLVASSSGQIVKVNSDKSSPLGWAQLTSAAMKKLQKETKAKGTKLLVTVSNFDSYAIETLITNKKATAALIKEIVNVVKSHNLDGVNLDFEYFTDSHHPAVSDLNAFYQDLILGLKKENPNYIVSYDVNALAVLVDGNYDMVKIGELFDQVILMAYDYYRPTSKTSGPIAPLFADEDEHSIDKSLQSLVGRVPNNKIIMAVPFLGYEWQTVDEEYKSNVIPQTGATASYERIQDLIKNRKDITINRDELSKSPWLTYKQSGAIKQIYYEDEVSLEKKLTYIKERKLGGIAVWALGFEGEYKELWETIDKNLK